MTYRTQGIRCSNLTIVVEILGDQLADGLVVWFFRTADLGDVPA
jgi:hypothetical protein